MDEINYEIHDDDNNIERKGLRGTGEGTFVALLRNVLFFFLIFFIE